MKKWKFLMVLFSLMCCTAMVAQNADALYEKGKDYYDAEKYDKAFPLLKSAAEKGHKKAQYRLGRCYSKGRGVAEDDAMAAKWYQKSVDQGYSKAEYQLAKCYVKGNGVPKDEAKALALLKKAIGGKKHGKEIKAKMDEEAAEGKGAATRLKALLKKN